MRGERKGRRRTHKPTPIDDDLMALATTLSEYQLDNNAYGWFRPAWRNGEWAIGLAKIIAINPGIGEGYPDHYDEALEVLDGPRDVKTYERACELHRALVQPNIGTNTARLLAAALRCLALLIANSHGGGTVYNEILIPAFLPLDLALVADDVLAFRCQDAIGTSHQMRGDRNDRLRAAFTIAWRRGLYLAAYSIPPAF